MNTDEKQKKNNDINANPEKVEFPIFTRISLAMTYIGKINFL